MGFARRPRAADVAQCRHRLAPAGRGEQVPLAGPFPRIRLGAPVATAWLAWHRSFTPDGVSALRAVARDALQGSGAVVVGAFSRPVPVRAMAERMGGEMTLAPVCGAAVATGA
jgi:hypothetical protein